MIDLHIHTIASDGIHSPFEVVTMAAQRGIKAMAITDHGTVSGISEAVQAGIQCGVEVISGIELNTLWEEENIHILGYFLNYEDPTFLTELQHIQGFRHQANLITMEKLQSLGIDISLEEVRHYHSGMIGRPQIASTLVAKGIVSSIQEAFDNYLDKGKPAYYGTVPRISPFQAIDLIHSAGGLPVLAHPAIYGCDELIPSLISYGLDGIECYHPKHTEDDQKRYLSWCEPYGLASTGGSDFHGEKDGKIYHGALGSQPLSYERLNLLKQRMR